MLLELPALKIDSVEIFSFIRANLFTGSFLKIHCVNLWLFFHVLWIKTVFIICFGYLFMAKGNDSTECLQESNTCTTIILLNCLWWSFYRTAWTVQTPTDSECRSLCDPYNQHNQSSVTTSPTLGFLHSSQGQITGTTFPWPVLVPRQFPTHR